VRGSKWQMKVILKRQFYVRGVGTDKHPEKELDAGSLLL
tara:strand:+ start:340 stop:456 length:117 start_codon:yes stop_codon:yes gene_type:complete